MTDELYPNEASEQVSRKTNVGERLEDQRSSRSQRTSFFEDAESGRIMRYNHD
jgi:hypothetical protein